MITPKAKPEWTIEKARIHGAVSVIKIAVKK